MSPMEDEKLKTRSALSGDVTPYPLPISRCLLLNPPVYDILVDSAVRDVLLDHAADDIHPIAE